MPMNQDRWDAMTGPERADYLRTREIKVKTQTFLDTSSKVGSPKITVGRKAVCGGVTLTPWLTDEPETVIAAARERIESIANEAA
mgnify:CR=1 FL=1